MLERHVKDVHTGEEDLAKRLKSLVQEVKNFGRSRYGRRYCKFTISRALSCYRSKGQWNLVRSACLLPLPSVSTIARFKNLSAGQPGFPDANLERLKAAVEVQKVKHAEYGLVSFDEMSIRAGIYFNPHTERYTGYRHYPNPETGQHEIADKVLQFSYIGLLSKFAFPIGHYATKGLNSSELCIWTKKAIEVSGFILLRSLFPFW